MDGPLRETNGILVMGVAWARDEMATADFGDGRLDRRAAVVLGSVGDCPNLSIPAACRGRAEMTAAYRFFDNPKVTFQKVLRPHVERTLGRLGERKVVLLVQDTTEIDLTRPNQDVAGAGELDGVRRGTLLHVLHGFTPAGTPLGTAWAHCINRPEVSHAPKSEKRQRSKRTPIEGKESMRWLQGMRRSREVAAELPGVRVVCVGDSESDIYECIAEPRAEPGGHTAHDWLVRACYDRPLQAGDATPAGLREAALAGPVLYSTRLSVRARRAVTAVERRVRRRSRDHREADVEVHAATVTLRPPVRRGRKLPPVTVNVVLVQEPNPPEGQVPIEWLLLTSLPVGTRKQVRTVVAYYRVRWNIEILFRTLKGGCRIERRRFEHIDRLLPCLALYLIAAWRTLLVCRLGREHPEADCEVLFEPSEWKAAWAAAGMPRVPPAKRPSLGQIIRLVARLGGYVDRPGSDPGPQTIWIGLQRLHDLALAWEAFGPDTRGPS